jgi:hypothetical protein
MKKDEKREKIITAAGKVLAGLASGRQGWKKLPRKQVWEKVLFTTILSARRNFLKQWLSVRLEHLKNEIIRATKDITDPYKRMKIYVISRMKAFNESINLYTAVKTNYLDHLPFIDKVTDQIRQGRDEDGRKHPQGRGKEQPFQTC